MLRAMKNFCRVAILITCGAMLLAGCAPMGVPYSAKICSQGQHPGCTSSGPGSFWVYDKTARAMVANGSVDANQDISVDPAGNHVTVDGNPIPTSHALDAGHDYVIYFQQAGK
ncbi:MAG TPA: hypothetical protein VN541_03315 [Tepidisphaeraceae bacterium]|nr:hypothetical protein [Tepidisphaeraceae bacterium]